MTATHAFDLQLAFIIAFDLHLRSSSPPTFVSIHHRRRPLSSFIIAVDLRLYRMVVLIVDYRRHCRLWMSSTRLQQFQRRVHPTNFVRRHASEWSHGLQKEDRKLTSLTRRRKQVSIFLASPPSKCFLWVSFLRILLCVRTCCVDSVWILLMLVKFVVAGLEDWRRWKKLKIEVKKMIPKPQGMAMSDLYRREV